MPASYTERFTEEWELIDVYNGVAVPAATEVNSGYNNMGNFHRIAILIIPLTLNDALSVDIEQSTNALGTDAKTVNGYTKDIVVATTDTLPSAIEIQMEEMDVTGQFSFLNVEIITDNTGGQANYFYMLLFGLPRYQPASTAVYDSVTG